MAALPDSGNHSFFSGLGLSLDLHLVGGFDRIEKPRPFMSIEDFDVLHDAMPANDTGQILDRGEETDLCVERHNLVVVGVPLVAIAFYFLCPRYHQSKECRFSQFGQFGCLRRRKYFGLQTERFEMARCLFSGCTIAGAHELRILAQIIQHTGVFAAYRAIDDRSVRSFRYCPSGSYSDRAVYDC